MPDLQVKELYWFVWLDALTQNFWVALPGMSGLPRWEWLGNSSLAV
jgi:hypothetical protein